MSKATRTVKATCPCGVVFDREVKRGRPQRWCPTCVEVPFYERQAAEAVEGEEPVAEKIVSEFDDLAHVRDLITEGIAEADANHKARYAAAEITAAELFKGSERVDELERLYKEDISAVYVQYRGRA